MRPSFFQHLHPPTIPARQSRFRYTLAAGGLAVFLMLILLVTGILEMFYYIPTPDRAAESIQTLIFLVPFGALIRNLHYWSAQFLVMVILVHLLRVIFTGAYTPPRGFNYLLGLGLLVLSIFLDFSGLVLRWDQGIHWALIAGTNLIKSIPLIGPGLYRLLVGGSEPGAATLIRFYAWHVFGLTLLAAIGVSWHIFRVRRDGGIAVPPPMLRRDLLRVSRKELLRREVLAMLLSGIGLLALSSVASAPIAAPIQTGPALTEQARAPWFFLWVQQLLKLGSPFLWGVLVPLLVMIFLALIPSLFSKIPPEERGEWFPRSGRAVQWIVAFIVILILILSILALFPSVSFHL